MWECNSGKSTFITQDHPVLCGGALHRCSIAQRRARLFSAIRPVKKVSESPGQARDGFARSLAELHSALAG
jgi:hypothetical protein